MGILGIVCYICSIVIGPLVANVYMAPESVIFDFFRCILDILLLLLSLYEQLL